MILPEACRKLEGRLIASCQASQGDAFRDSALIAKLAQAALAGGAAGLRVDGPKDVRAVRTITSAPIIGIQKTMQADGKVLITPSLEAGRELVQAGADMIALDATARGQSSGALERIGEIERELHVPVLADISTLEEALAAANAGATLILSTLRGYTSETSQVKRFEPGFVAELSRNCPVPVIAEGRIHSPEQARQAIDSGAYAVVVGTAITRPAEIARRFAAAIEAQFAFRGGAKMLAAIDLGGTHTKFGLVTSSGKLLLESSKPTPASAGRVGLLDHLKQIAADLIASAQTRGLPCSALGIATAGWVNSRTGTVAYATETLAGWSGTPIAEEIGSCIKIPVSVENDANALAVGEKYFGAGREFNDFVCMTLGTGVGGGCYVGGKLNQGAHFFANALGHVVVEPDGLVCACGQRGCLEMYCNSSALLRYAGGRRFADAKDIIQSANGGDADATAAIERAAHYLALGCSSIIHLLDPEALIVSGGLAQDNPVLISALNREVLLRVPECRKPFLKILVSPLGYHGGVLGAAAIAMEHSFPA